MTRDFLSLTPREVLALGIHIERANASRFVAFADAFGGYDDEVARQFRELADEERRHEEMLRAKFVQRFGPDVPDVDEMSVAGVIESVDLDDAEHQVFDSLAPDRVFDLALAAERRAHAFYARAAAFTEDTELGTLYRELERMESEHASWVEDRVNERRFRRDR